MAFLVSWLVVVAVVQIRCGELRQAFSATKYFRDGSSAASPFKMFSQCVVILSFTKAFNLALGGGIVQEYYWVFQLI